MMNKDLKAGLIFLAVGTGLVGITLLAPLFEPEPSISTVSLPNGGIQCVVPGVRDGREKAILAAIVVREAQGGRRVCALSGTGPA